MKIDIEVKDYSLTNLIEFFSKPEYTSIKHIKNKSHIQYLDEYFKELKTKTILVENTYIDRDFFEDYSAYYVRSFINYNRFCHRFHFFDIQFSLNDFLDLVSKKESNLTIEKINNSYIGFIVCKPLPKTVIGRTCLKTYPCEGRRYFLSTREYTSNILGISLKVNSIAFQEQDNIVAACASTALWTAFQITGKLFQHKIPSPIEITKAATQKFPFANRYIPNKGLTAEQIADAIRNVNLEPVLINIKDEYIAKLVIYSYLNAKIPLILGVKLLDYSDENNFPREMGLHAVTITGYSLDEKNEVSVKNNLKLKSNSINKIYVHDDQIGPFSRMEFDNFNLDPENNPSVNTSWKNKVNIRNDVRAKLLMIIVPQYHKIRIPKYVILNVVTEFNNYLDFIFKKLKIEMIVWDIKLSTVNNFKSEILNSDKISSDEKIRVLTMCLPKYMWRAIILLRDDIQIEFLFDATDIEQGDVFISTVIYDTTFYKKVKLLMKMARPKSPSSKLEKIFENITQ